MRKEPLVSIHCALERRVVKHTHDLAPVEWFVGDAAAFDDSAPQVDLLPKEDLGLLCCCFWSLAWVGNNACSDHKFQVRERAIRRVLLLGHCLFTVQLDSPHR